MLLNKKKAKQLTFRVFFAGQILFFGINYFFGSRGLQVLRALKHQNEQLQQNVSSATKDIAKLEEELTIWQQDPFYIEKIAREQLQLAKPGEEIYIIS